MAKIALLHGPNLNLLGTRETHIYGAVTLADIDARVAAAAAPAHDVRAFQSNHEGALIDFLHDARAWADGIVINPGALTHYSCLLYTSDAADE